MKLLSTFVLAIIVFLYSSVAAQHKATWKRTETPTVPQLQLFHSTHAFSLPTTESHRKGDFEFEISHRFIPPIDLGYDELYGFDGPVNIRFALGYAATDRMLVTLGRSNLDNNLDLSVKYKAHEINNSFLPTLIAYRAGISWNATETARLDESGQNLITRPKDYKAHWQYYLQGIINAMYRKRVAIGVVPSYLVNRDIRMVDWQNSFILGSYLQVYLSTHWSLVGEWSPTLTDKFGKRNPGAVGVELETGGHFFKLFVTNSTQLNLSQYLAGADDPFSSHHVRLGFLITRLL